LTKKCSTSRCEIDTYKNIDKCILHCEKNSYASDFDKSNFLPSFYNELIAYIVKSFFDSYPKDVELLSEESLISSLKETDIKQDFVTTWLQKKVLTLVNISFPFRDSRDSFDYLQILRKLDNIHFLDCTFVSDGLVR